MTVAELIAFERDVANAFEARQIPGPIHLSGGNEDKLIEIFKNVKPTDWVLSTWRSHYHALLHGIAPEKVLAQIMAGRSMNLNFPEQRFLTSAIVGGILPIACGLAHAGERVWCFIGDMTASIGAFQDAMNYGCGVNYIIEDNGLSTNTPTITAWRGWKNTEERYHYERIYPHTGSGRYVAF